MGYFVYIHTNLTNGKRYVGLTTQKPIHRWGHQGNHYRGNKHFWSAIQKYGWDGFEHTVIECDTREEMIYLEKYFIAFYETKNPIKGYNVLPGGQTLDGPNNPNFGNHKLAGSANPMYGSHRCGKDNPNYGNHFKMSDETRRKMSETKRNKSKKNEQS